MGRWPLLVNVALNQWREPVLLDILSDELSAQAIVPHVPRVRVLHHLRTTTILSQLLLDAPCQVHIEAKKATVRDVLLDLLEDRSRFIEFVLGHLGVKSDEFNRLQRVHDRWQFVRVYLGHATDFSAFSDHDQVVRLVDVQYAEETQHFGAFVPRRRDVVDCYF